MTEFKREERYLVIKLKQIDSEKESALRAMQLPLTDCVVVESDWPEYEAVWELLESRVTGHRKTAELMKLLVEPCDCGHEKIQTTDTFGKPCCYACAYSVANPGALTEPSNSELSNTLLDERERVRKLTNENQSLRLELDRASRLNKEWQDIFDPIFEYCKENSLGKLGESYTKALVNSHAAIKADLNRCLSYEGELKQRVSMFKRKALEQQKEIQHLQAKVRLGLNYKGSFEVMSEGYGRLSGEIKELQAENVQLKEVQEALEQLTWISVDQELPVSSGEYECKYDGHYSNDVGRYNHSFFPWRRYWSDEIFTDRKVTYWRPLKQLQGDTNG